MAEEKKRTHDDMMEEHDSRTEYIGEVRRAVKTQPGISKYVVPGSVEFFAEKFPDIPSYCHEYLSIKTQKGDDAAQDFLRTNDKPGIISNVPQEDGTTKPVLVNW